ncbi:hypothetical protein QBC41DRAFT_326085 [Cercophora samala]|uniref:Uncharacterized protein n=1 Tax=Cercophora samala TaxID=330535 RepID=A0AA39Z8M8_9PEZI|nr:hypothetical protein QBC41DRAFT_326085 [Cercophora samala]
MDSVLSSDIAISFVFVGWVQVHQGSGISTTIKTMCSLLSKHGSALVPTLSSAHLALPSALFSYSSSLEQTFTPQLPSTGSLTSFNNTHTHYAVVETQRQEESSESGAFRNQSHTLNDPIMTKLEHIDNKITNFINHHDAVRYELAAAAIIQPHRPLSVLPTISQTQPRNEPAIIALESQQLTAGDSKILVAVLMGAGLAIVILIFLW